LPEELRPVSKSLYRAVRGGLMHRYEARVIVVDGDAVGIAIAWRGERHVIDRDRVYLSAERLVADLR
jgi:hypothetical protein